MRIKATKEEFFVFCVILPLAFVFAGIIWGGDNSWIGFLLAFFPPMFLYLKSKKTDE